MENLTEKQLIGKLQELKSIKPRQEWVSSLKAQVLAERKVEVQAASFSDILSTFVFQKKMAYSFAVLLMIVMGVAGLMKIESPESVKNQVAVSGQVNQVEINQSVVSLNNKINNLVKVSKLVQKDGLPSAIKEVTVNAKNLAKSLRATEKQDPIAIKDLASSLKTLADVQGTDITSNSDVKDLYQTVVQSQIADLQKTTLTDDQKKILTEAEALYKEGKYGEAFEKIYSINQTSQMETGK